MCENDNKKSCLNGEERNVINGIDIQWWHERNEYHRSAMESRRSIQMKVFTGCIVVLLGIAKWGIDIINNQAVDTNLFPVLAVSIITVPVFLFFFMMQIERVNKKNREWYHFYENKIDRYFSNDEERSTKKKEGLIEAIFRSWAATWPVIATFSLAMMLIIAFKSIENSKDEVNKKIGLSKSFEETVAEPNIGLPDFSPESSIENESE